MCFRLTVTVVLSVGVPKEQISIGRRKPREMKICLSSPAPFDTHQTRKETRQDAHADDHHRTGACHISLDGQDRYVFVMPSAGVCAGLSWQAKSSEILLAVIVIGLLLFGDVSVISIRCPEVAVRAAARHDIARGCRLIQAACRKQTDGML